MGILSVPVALGLCDRGFHCRCGRAGHALLFQRPFAVILCSGLQTNEAPCWNDSNLLDGHSHNYATLSVRDYGPREIVRNESHSDIRGWRFPYGFHWILDVVGSGYASEN